MDSASTSPAGHPGHDAPELAQLQAYVSELESQQTSVIEAGVQHLRELATLNRMADTLASRRSFRQVLVDTVVEAARIAGTDRVWLIETDARHRPATIHRPDPDRRGLGFDQLPVEVRDLYERVVHDQAGTPHRLPSYSDQQRLYLGLPVLSSRHVVGVLVHACDRPEQADARHTLRLLQSMLRQSAIACENARLMDVMSRMIVQVVTAMAAAVESRDPYTGGHTQRVTSYALLLGRHVGLDSQALTCLRLGGLLHDIGKVAVPDAILRKPGRLTPEEFAVIQTHPVVGDRIVARVPPLEATQPIVRHHHERYDGRGYPDGLAGRQIPWLARILAVADTFDAMTSDRPYRRGMAVDTVLAEIRANAGTQFDPELAPVFAELSPEALTHAAGQTHDGPETDLGSLDLRDMFQLDLPPR